MTPSAANPPDDFRSDDELARAFQRGDARASAELVRRHGLRLRAFVFGESRWAAAGEDILRQTWAAAEQLLRAGKYRGGGFRVWLFKLAEQLASRLAAGATSSQALRLARCVRRLQKARPQWHQLVLWISHGTSRTGVAKRMNMPKEKLKKRYKRALAAVRACLAKRPTATADDPGGGR